MDELTLPSFEMDCRDWLVVDPGEVGLPEEVAGSPVVAVLSTAVIEDETLYSIGAVLSLGLLDDDDRSEPTDEISELIDPDGDGRILRYVVAAPGRQLGLLAEFTLDDFAGSALRSRVEALLASFRWAA
jgi:hypothetical protein